MKAHWAMTWHEDREISPGVPDLHYSMGAKSEHKIGWLELKAIDKPLSKSNKIHVEASQHQYIRKWGDLMPIHFLIRIQTLLYVVESRYHATIPYVELESDFGLISVIQFDQKHLAEVLPGVLRDITRI